MDSLDQMILEGHAQGIACASVCDTGLPEVPTPHVLAAARVLAWLRQMKKSIKWCQSHSCFPGPSGYKAFTNNSGRMLWVPRPEEGCICQVDFFRQEPPHEKPRYLPFAYYHHCKTLQHCIYMVQRRLPYVMSRIPQNQFIKAVKALRDDKVLLLINDPDPLIQEFFKGWCAGEVPSTGAYTSPGHQDPKESCLSPEGSHQQV